MSLDRGTASSLQHLNGEFWGGGKDLLLFVPAGLSTTMRGWVPGGMRGRDHRLQLDSVHGAGAHLHRSGGIERLRIQAIVDAGRLMGPGRLASVAVRPGTPLAFALSRELTGPIWSNCLGILKSVRNRPRPTQKLPVDTMRASSDLSRLSPGCRVRSPTPIFDPWHIAPAHPAIRRLASASFYIPFTTHLRPCF